MQEQSNRTATVFTDSSTACHHWPQPVENPKTSFCFYYKSYKNFHDVKYCTFHRSVIIFFNLSYKIIYTRWKSKRKKSPLQKYSTRNKKHFFFTEMFTPELTILINLEHLVAHAEQCHSQNKKEVVIQHTCSISNYY